MHGFAGFLGILWVGVFAAGYPTGLNNVESSIGGQLMGMATFLPLGFLTGWFASWVLKKLNLLRVRRRSSSTASTRPSTSRTSTCPSSRRPRTW